jgi:hypothetical protein
MQQLFDSLTKPGSEGLGMVLLTLLVCLTVVTCVALVQWRKLRQSEQRAVLLQEMIQRGMAADEILQVIAVSQGSAPQPRKASPARLQETADYKG